MKKLFLIAVAFVFLAGARSEASSYKLDDATVDNMFAASEEISFEENATLSNVSLTNSVKSTAGDKTVGGFLLRSYFCGFIALHRSYMGTGGKSLLLYYLCIPVASGVVNCVDFWWVVFKGKEALDKYADNPKWIVW